MLDILKIYITIYNFNITITGDNDVEGEFKVKNINLNGETKPDETIQFKYTAQIEATDMASDQLMSANAIQGYVKDYTSQNIPSIDHTHTSSQISDRIDKYISKVIDIVPDEGIFTFDGPFDAAGAFGDDQYYIKFSNSIGFTLNYKEQIFEIEYSGSYVEKHLDDLGLLIIPINGKLFFPLDISEPLTLKLTNIKDGDITYSNTTITVYGTSITDMSVDKLISANAVQGYVQGYVNARVEEILKEKGVIQ